MEVGQIVKELLSRVVEVSVASGEVTGGSTTTLEDTNAVWPTDKWIDAIVEITHVADRKHYFVTPTSNTSDTLTFGAISVTVASGDHYEIRVPLRLMDLDKWGGTSLTGRDVSGDLQALTDDSIKGLFKSIGDIGAGSNIAIILGAIKTAVEIIDNFVSGSRGLVTEDNSSTIAGAVTPLEKAAQHGVAETADTDILGTDLTPTNTPCLFRIMVILETTGVFSAMLKNGGVTKQLKLNNAVSLTADCAYMFDILVHSGDTVNFQTSASGNVTLRVQEIVGGVQ